MSKPVFRASCRVFIFTHCINKKYLKKKKKYHTVETFLKSNGKNHRKWQNQHHYHTNTRLLTFQSW